MHHIDPGRRQVLCATRVRRDDRKVAAPIRPRDLTDLSFANRSRHFWFENRIGAAGPTTQAIILEVDDIGHMLDDLSHRLMDSLNVSEVARLLHDHGWAWLMTRGQSIELLGQPFVSITNPRGELIPIVAVEQVAVVLEGGPTTGRVDQNRGGPRCRSDHLASQ